MTNWLICFSSAPGLLSIARVIFQIDRWETLQICGFRPLENLRHCLVILRVVLKQLLWLSPVSKGKSFHWHLKHFQHSLHSTNLLSSISQRKIKSIRQKFLQLLTSLPTSIPFLSILPPVPEKEVVLELWILSSLTSVSIFDSHKYAYVLLIHL